MNDTGEKQRASTRTVEIVTGVALMMFGLWVLTNGATAVALGLVGLGLIVLLTTRR